MNRASKFLSKYFWVVLIGIIFFLPEANANNQPWEITKSKHFIVYHHEGSPEYINQLIHKAEHYYRSIADYLGFRRFNFWTWDNRCKIYLYSDQKDYLRETGYNLSWSRAHVHVIKKEINTYMWQDRFFDTILPHEMGHIIFREFVGYKIELPLWLDEGVACMQEFDNQERLMIAKGLVGWSMYIRLKELSQIRDYSLVIPFIFYNESASLVDFLLRKFGRNQFVVFCRHLRDNEDWQEALTRVYKIKDVEELEKLWIDDLSD